MKQSAMKRTFALRVAVASAAGAQAPRQPEVQQYVSVDAPVVALTHARVVDGTGAPARADQTVVVENGVIRVHGCST